MAKAKDDFGQQESKILWSEEVARAEASHPLPPNDPTYEMSNGRKFVEPPNGGGPYKP